MINRLAIAVSLICIVLFVGCNRANQFVPLPTEENSSNPVIYFFGDKWTKIYNMEIVCNNRKIGELGSQSYLNWIEKPGKLSFSIYPCASYRSWKSNNLKFELEAKEFKEYYLRLNRIFKTEQESIKESLAKIPFMILVSFMFNQTGFSSARSATVSVTIAVEELPEEEALKFIKKWKPPELFIPE